MTAKTKWNELPDGQELELTEDLMFLPEGALQDGMIYTRMEILALLEVAYPIGTVLTFNLDEVVLEDADGGIVTQVPALYEEVQDRFKIL